MQSTHTVQENPHYARVWRRYRLPGEFSGQQGVIGTAFAWCNFFEADTQVHVFHFSEADTQVHVFHFCWEIQNLAGSLCDSFLRSDGLFSTSLAPRPVRLDLQVCVIFFVRCQAPYPIHTRPLGPTCCWEGWAGQGYPLQPHPKGERWDGRGAGRERVGQARNGHRCEEQNYHGTHLLNLTLEPRQPLGV